MTGSDLHERIITLEAKLAERDADVGLFRALLERASACLDLRSWRHLYDEIEATLTPTPKEPTDG